MTRLPRDLHVGPAAMMLPTGLSPMHVNDVPLAWTVLVGNLIRHFHHGQTTRCDRCFEVARLALAEAANLVKSDPMSDDPVACWLRTQRDNYPAVSGEYITLNSLVDLYRRHADTGTRLTGVPDNGPGDDDRRERLRPTEHYLHEPDQVDLRDAEEAYADAAGGHRPGLAAVWRVGHRAAGRDNAIVASIALLEYRDMNHRHNDRAEGWCICGSGWDISFGLDGGGCEEYRALTDAAGDARGGREPVATATDRAGAAYSASGTMVDADSLPLALDDLADKLAAEYLRFRDAFHAGRVDSLHYPNAAIADALAVVAALCAALGYPATVTATNITTAHLAEPRSEHGDEVRLHLVSEHADPAALGMSDATAARHHVALHTGGYLHDRGRLGTIPHDPGGLAWAPHRADAVLLALDPGEAAGYRPVLDEHLARAAKEADRG